MLWAAPAPGMTGATAIVAVLVARHLKTADDLFDNKLSPRTDRWSRLPAVGAYQGVRPLRHGVTNMTVDDFRQSLTVAKPPAELTLALLGLWWDGRGDWTRAHESAQQDEVPEGSWVHAYLHRKEGDQGNAVYWYGRAVKPVCREPLDAEWLGIVRVLLG
jgi:hypothetical protein